MMFKRVAFQKTTSLIRCFRTSSSRDYSYVENNKTNRKEINAEAAACRSELDESAVIASRRLLLSRNIADITVEPNMFSALCYVLAFDRGRFMNETDVREMSRLLPQISKNAKKLSLTDLAIISAAMHRAQLAISDRRLMSALLNALSECTESSVGLRLLKILDLSIRRSLPPESLPVDEKLVRIGKSISLLFLNQKLSPLYCTRLLRFWQKLRITTPDLDKATHRYLQSVLQVDENRPLRKWRVKDISQATFTCGFFMHQWSSFTEAVLQELECRLAEGYRGSPYRIEIERFPDAYFQTVFGLLAHLNGSEFSRIKSLVKNYEIFSRPPSKGARSIEAWMSVRAACELPSNSNLTKSSQSETHQLTSGRLTGRQYMVLQVADAARAAFPRSQVKITNLLPAFASKAKLDVVINNIVIRGKSFDVSLLPLPELACFRYLAYVDRPAFINSPMNNFQNKLLVSIFRPQGSEMLRLRSINNSGLVDLSLPLLWPTWRGLRERNKHVFVRNAVLKALSRK